MDIGSWWCSGPLGPLGGSVWFLALRKFSLAFGNVFWTFIGVPHVFLSVVRGDV